MYNIDLRCAFGTAIISVLIYCLLVTLIVPDGADKLQTSPEWWKSLEILMLISVFVGYNLNNNFVSLCKVSLS